MSKDKVIVVFEYTKGRLAGGQFWTMYPLDEIEKVRKETEESDSDKKIVAVNVSQSEAISMCHKTLQSKADLLKRLIPV